jgi:hypothetical protein
MLWTIVGITFECICKSVLGYNCVFQQFITHIPLTFLSLQILHRFIHWSLTFDPDLALI